MALSGVLRPGFIQIRVLDMPAAIEHYTKRIGFHQVCEGPDGRVYLKAADEFDHHSIVLRRAGEAGVDITAFKCLEDADLDRFAKRVEDYGFPVDHVPAGEQPGSGRRIGFTIASGHRIELYAQSEMSEPHPLIHNPTVWEVEPHGMRARRFDHALLYGPDIEKNLDFFTRVLDFRCAERVDMPDGLLAIWLTCGMKAHDIAFVKYPEP
ncbi:VOC family protein, partial [Rhodoblastus sp.]|uniref:VOC family protein n=1 Tax=Rhodoblastus sp. TaxID=1962975 RepID=UPI0035ADD175